MIEITEKWLVDGELCVRGTYKGYAFGAHYGEYADCDFGWHNLSYLPQYKDEKWDMPDDIYDELDELITCDDALNVYALKAEIYAEWANKEAAQ